MLGPVRFAEKISRNIVLADLLWEKNTVSAEKISWKRQIIREANIYYQIAESIVETINMY